MAGKVLIVTAGGGEDLVGNLSLGRRSVVMQCVCTECGSMHAEMGPTNLCLGACVRQVRVIHVIKLSRQAGAELQLTQTQSPDLDVF